MNMSSGSNPANASKTFLMKQLTTFSPDQINSHHSIQLKANESNHGFFVEALLEIVEANCRREINMQGCSYDPYGSFGGEKNGG